MRGKARRLDEDLGASEAKQSHNRKEKNQTNDTQVPPLRSYWKSTGSATRIARIFTNGILKQEGNRENGVMAERSVARKMGSTGGNGENRDVAKR